MNRGSGDGSRSDPKRRCLEDVEGLLEFDSSDVVVFEQGLNGLRFECYGTLGVEEEFEELAEERVQGAVTRSERQEMRPTSYEKLADLRAESHVVFDELISSAQKLF